MESKFCTYKRVGYLRQKVAKELGIEFTGVIYASPGVLKHIIKRHGRQLDRQTRNGILERVYTNLLLGVELDEENQYIYVTTMYPITDKKIENRIYSGKLINIKGKK